MNPPTTRAQLPVVLLPSRWKQALLLVLCVAFAALGAFMAHEGSWVGYPLALLFGLGCAVFIVNLHPHAAYLRLEHDSFTFRSLFRSHTVLWVDCVQFGALNIRSHRMVAWSYVQGFQAKSTLRSASRALFEYDAALPDTYGMKAQALANTMQRLRDEAAAASIAVRPATAE